jgi:glycosyltransferase involved in cell wall biosynthesis
MPDVPALPPISTAALSVILLARDAAAHLAATVAAWVAYLNGLDRDYEVLVIDDGSGDGTAERGAELPERHGRVRFLRHEQRRGEGAALRTALAAAQRPLVCYAPCEPGYRPADLQRLLADIDRVHLIPGYRAGRPVPRFWRSLGRLWRGLCWLLFGQSAGPLPGWLGWRRHAGRLLARAVFGVRNRDVACPFRLLRRSILARIPIQSNGLFVHVEILAKANFLGCLIGDEVPLGDAQRPAPLAEPGARLRDVWADASRVFQHPDFGPVDAPWPPSEGSRIEDRG